MLFSAERFDIMRCNQCGREIPDGLKFCDFCGAPLSGAPRSASGAGGADDIPLDLKRKGTSDLFSKPKEKNDFADDTGSSDYDFGTFADGIEIDEPEDDPRAQGGFNDSFDNFAPDGGSDNGVPQKRKSLLWLWITLAVVAVAAIVVAVIIALNSGGKDEAIATPDQTLPATADQTVPATADQTSPATPDEISQTVPESIPEPTEVPADTFETEPENEYF